MIFNKTQQAFIDCKKNSLVYATAGTGKTSTLSQKIRNQIIQDCVSPEDILCLTFTNRGCEEMRKKISEDLDPEIFKKLTVKTFHAFCFELISKYRNGKGYGFNESIIFDEDDSKMICGFVCKEMNLTLYFKDNNGALANIVSHFKEACIEYDPDGDSQLEKIYKTIDMVFSDKDKNEELKNMFKNLLEEPSENPINDLLRMISVRRLKEFVAKYQKELVLSHGLDFCDLVYFAKQYLKDLSFKDSIDNRYKYIYIDEAQDTSWVEYSIIKQISSHSTVMLSGDFFQTIYEWRGSNPDKIIKDFIQTYSPEEFIYDINYRSTKNITYASFSVLNKFFPNEVLNKYKKGISAASAQGGDLIGLHRANDIESEARFINWDVETHQDADSCILTRTNKYAKDISDELKKVNPGKYFLVQDYQYYKRPEVKEILAFLRLIINPYDTVSLERIATKYVKGFGEVRLSDLTSQNSFDSGVRLSDLLDTKTHDYNGDVYGLLLEKLNGGNVVVFDTETTGLDIENDEVIQFACRKINRYGEEVSRFTTLVNTEKDVGESYFTHHISNNDLKEKGVKKEDAFRLFLDFIGDSILVGHNVMFDLSITNNQLERMGLSPIKNAFYDTLDISRRFIKETINYKLQTLTQKLNLPKVQYHDAMEDVIATSNLLIYLVENEILRTEKARKEIISKYLRLFNPLSSALSNYRSKLYDNGYVGFVSDVVKTLNMEKIYKDESSTFNIEHFIKLSEIVSSRNKTNYNCLYSTINLASLSTNDFDALYKEHGLIPIITVHQSKGCEFDTVYMPGVEENNYPHFYAKDSKEERRVFYVAITRAKKRLVLSFRDKKVTRWGKIVDVYPSQYLRYFDTQYLKKI